ncbi:MAG TPA: enoyl-CoA hydratase-related protein [Burkholderiales bacterium]|nr:enoyl-CoA hydratase-related protein [Burkholderiales bacterium]
MGSNSGTLRVEERPGPVLLVTLDRPEVANAFNTQAALDLCEFFDSLETEGRCRCIVLTGAGDKAFCAGADLKERNALGNEQWRAQHEIFERMFRSVRDCAVPVIAAVNGAAYAGGLELVLLCDFAYASKSAKFALTEVSLGIMPGGGGTQTLARAVGERRAKELILAAQPFSAEEALAWGVVNRLCEPQSLLGETLEAAAGIAANAPLAVREAKRAIRHGLGMDLASAMQLEIAAYNRLVGTEDRKEGVRAFNEKRKPKFKDC